MSGSDSNRTKRHDAVGAAVTVLVGLVVVGGVLFAAYTAIRKSPSAQDAANWISATSAAATAATAILTFYLLTTALKQLRILSQDLDSQAERHAKELASREDQRREDAEKVRQDLALREQQHREELEQARDDIASMQDILDVQTEALKLAKDDAVEARRETAKARLDLLAPRCSFRVIHCDVLVRPHGVDSDFSKITVEQSLPFSPQDGSIKVSIQFELENWGDEPVYYHVGGGLLEPQGYAILNPRGSSRVELSIMHSAEIWDAIRTGARSIVNWPEPDPNRNSRWIECAITVDSVGGEVVDTFTWGWEIMPLSLNGYQMVVRSGGQVVHNSHLIAHRKRYYAALREEDSGGVSTKISDLSA